MQQASIDYPLSQKPTRIPYMGCWPPFGLDGDDDVMVMLSVTAASTSQRATSVCKEMSTFIICGEDWGKGETLTRETLC